MLFRIGLSLASHINGGKLINGIWEQGAGENIGTDEGRCKRRLEKIT
jgi:hypothetical protein